MLSGDPFAFRPGASDDAPQALAIPIGTPEAPVAARSAERTTVRSRRWATAWTIALACHAVLSLLFVWAWRGMVRDVAVPDAIEVHTVDRVPGEEVKPTPGAALKPDPPPSQPPPLPAPASAEGTPAPVTPEPPHPTALDQALPSPLVEPPAEPEAAASQSAVNQKGNDATKTSADKDAAAGSPTAPADAKAADVAPAAPTVLTTTTAETSAPAPGQAATTKPPAAGDPARAVRKAAAQLSAALATESMPMPMSFRAALSARGDSTNADYRGSVFGAINRARQAVNAEAAAKRLKGQVILAIVLTDTGAIAQISVVQSSGSAAADALALDLIRRAAPFPPPPPGASHTFTPAIIFGAG